MWNTQLKRLLPFILLFTLVATALPQGVVRVQRPTAVVAGACGSGVDIGNGWCQIAHTIAGSANTTSVTTSGINTTGADLIVVVVSSYCAAHNFNAGDLTDSKGNTWSSAVSQCSSGSGDAGILLAYSKPSSVGASHTFSISNAQPTFPVITVYAVSGSHAVPIEQSGFASSASATSLATGSITTVANFQLIVTGWTLLAVNTGTPTVNAGMTVADFLNSDGVNYQSGGLARFTQATAAAINPTWSWVTSGAAIVAIASFKHS